MRLTPLAILLALFSFFGNSQAQELRGLNYNPVLMHAAKETPNYKSTGSNIPNSVPLPTDNIFFDDFSTYRTELYPDTKGNWLDRSATITRSLADSSISFGTITLDCFDANGDVYGPVGQINASDTLTSREISAEGGSNYFLSFFIQGGGKGDSPEDQDSILLELKSGKTKEWIYVWDLNGYHSHTFEQIIIPINDSLYTNDTIQFRFINYTSLSDNEVKGKKGALSNADNWLLDYIQIKSAASASEMENINDVTIFQPIKPIFTDYTHVPYDHLKDASGRTIESNSIWFRTIFPSETDIISIGRSHVYVDVTNNDTCEIVGRNQGIQIDVAPNTFAKETDRFILSQGFKTEDKNQRGEGEFHFKNYLNASSINDQYKWNDTITTESIFRDFYAYDDGSAEFGFGIAGNEAEGTRFASRFEIYNYAGTLDTLTGVYIYFNKAANDFNLDLEFQIAVWDVGTDNFPGDLIYNTGLDNLYTPESPIGLNNPSNTTDGFMLIEFNEDVLLSGQFYIGLVQYTENFLNVGYDVSFGSKSNIAFYSDNHWESASSLPDIPQGALMIRPKFGHYDYTTENKQVIQKIEQVDLYPNPASSIVNINLPNEYHNYTYKLFDVLGNEVEANTLNANSIYVEHLPSGLYILQLTDLNSKQQYSQKLLKK